MEYEKSIKRHKVFEDLTTYRNDYRKYVNLAKEIKVPTLKYEEDEPEKPPETPVLQDFETLRRIKEDAYIPFNLFWEKRPIVGTDPRDTYTPKFEVFDTGKEEAIRTRPRLYMSPAVSIDDVPDAKMRELLCSYMYTTDWRKAEKEAAGPVKARDVPLSVLSVLETSYKREQLPPPTSEWRQKGIAWDRNQNRALVDPTRSFWLSQDVTERCEDVVDPLKKHVPQVVKDHIDSLIRKDELRKPHDLFHSSYTGYQPTNAYGVSLDKVHLPVTHPLLTVAQARTARCAEPDVPLFKPEPKKSECRDFDPGKPVTAVRCNYVA